MLVGTVHEFSQHIRKRASTLDAVGLERGNFEIVPNHLVHFVGRLFCNVDEAANDLSRNANRNRVRRKIGYYECASTDLATLSDDYISQDCCTGSQQDPILHFRVSIDSLLATSTECYMMQDTTIVSHLNERNGSKANIEYDLTSHEHPPYS